MRMAPAYTHPSSGLNFLSRTETVSPIKTRSLFKTTLIVISHVVHNKVRYHQDQLDIQHAAGILASQFDYSNINIHPHPHLLETPLNLHSNQNPHHHSSYQSDFPLPQRNHLGLDIPPHAYPNTRLPPPPAHGAAVNLSYQGPPNRRYSAEDLRPQSYSSGGGSAPPPVIQTPESTRSSVPISESTPQPQPAASTSQDPPRREISNQVIACRQWCVHSYSSFRLLIHVVAKSCEENSVRLHKTNLS